jgi:hypothetical protein
MCTSGGSWLFSLAFEDSASRALTKKAEPVKIEGAQAIGGQQIRGVNELALGYSLSGCGPFPPSAIKRSMRSSNTGSGTEPKSRTVS